MTQSAPHTKIYRKCILGCLHRAKTLTLMSTDKPWDRPWSMDEIVAKSDNWNLAGDVALLNTLKSFADNLLTRTNEINNNLQNLTNNLDETSLQLDIAQNEFQNLRNTQFIESRVYEDDENLPQNEEKSKVEEKTDHTEEIRAAAVKGLEVLDQYFDRVEVAVSDSDDDDIDLPNYVLRPKDLYIDRPLPYIIGSDEWHKNWHVGLEDSSSDSETEKVSDKFSESDSESDLPIIQDRSQIRGTSDTSSELDFSQKIEPKMTKNDFFNSSDSDQSGPAQGPISTNTFAEQLAAKLGHVITQGGAEPEVNTRPIQPQKSNFGDVFFDEPPPLDEPKGMFSGGGLFDDDEDEDLPYAAPKTDPKSKTGLFDDSDEDIFVKKNPLSVTKPPIFAEEPPSLDEKKKPVGGVSIFGGGNLFDKKLLRRPSSDDEIEEEEKSDFFKNSPDKASTTGVKKVNLFDSDEEDTKDLFQNESAQKSGEKTVKKLNLFDDLEKIKTPEKTSEKEEKAKKEISLFDDDDDLFKDDLFSSSSTKKFTSGLFGDTSGDLFATDYKQKPKSPNLFDDLVSIPDKNSINNNDSQNTGSGPKVAEIEKTNSLFTSSPKEITEKLSITSPEENIFDQKPEKASSSPAEPKKEPPLPKPRLRLFDSPPPEPDDLFGNEKSSSDLFAPPTAPSDNSLPEINPVSSNHASSVDLFAPIADPASPNVDLFAPVSDLFAGSPSKADPAPSGLFDASPPTTSIPNMRPFDPSPPPDDEWEPKSENLSDDDLTNDFEDVKTQKTDLFSEEPPSLDFKNETTPKINNPKPGKLRHNLNINVGALMPGYVPPKRTDGAATVSRDQSGDVVKTTDDVGASRDSVDEPDRVEVLQSVTKDRVKVPLKRRPSTRRGRKEALRRSLSDFNLEQDKSEDSSPEKTQSDDLLDTVEISGKGPEKEIKAVFETEKESENLFGKIPETNLADSKSTNLATENPPDEHGDFPQVEPKKSKDNLFDDDDEDDLFSTKKTVRPVKKKKSLFDDDDDDDIFGGFSTASIKKPDTKMAAEKKIPKVSSVKKLENTKSDDDPLSALLK